MDNEISDFQKTKRAVQQVMWDKQALSEGRGRSGTFLDATIFQHIAIIVRTKFCTLGKEGILKCVADPSLCISFERHW